MRRLPVGQRISIPFETALTTSTVGPVPTIPIEQESCNRAMKPFLKRSGVPKILTGPDLKLQSGSLAESKRGW